MPPRRSTSPVPSAPAPVISSVLPSTTTPPEKMLSPLSARRPPPSTIRPPAPLIGPEKPPLPVLVSTKAQPSSTRSEEHTSELQSLMLISYAIFWLKKKKTHKEERVN